MKNITIILTGTDLTKGAPKAYASYTIKNAAGETANYDIAAPTMAELDAHITTQRAYFKQTGVTMRRDLAAEGDWPLEHITTTHFIETGRTILIRP